MINEDLKTGSRHYKAYVGPLDRYDFMGATQFRLLTALGLRAHHKLLDFGCGSLRSGKLFIPYLDCGNYFGQDPDQWLIDEGINAELGREIVEIKKPSFANNSDFSVGFNESFDYVVAQSVFSHTDEELTRKGLKSLVCSMTEEGLAMVTIKEGVDYAGNEKWVYPGSTTYSPNKIADMLGDSGCYWRRLWWFHPAQTWFVLTKSKQRLPGVLDSFFLLGGEEVGSKQYDRQGFISNRIFSLMKKHELTKKLFK